MDKGKQETVTNNHELTALQEFIKWGDEMIKNNPFKVLGFGEAIDKAEELLNKEQKQLEQAWHDGNLLGRNGHILEEYDNGKGYYKHNYEKK